MDEITFEICDQYPIHAELFAQVILGNKAVPTSLEDSLLNMIVVDALFESGQTAQCTACAKQLPGIIPLAPGKQIKIYLSVNWCFSPQTTVRTLRTEIQTLSSRPENEKGFSRKTC